MNWYRQVLNLIEKCPFSCFRGAGLTTTHRRQRLRLQCTLCSYATVHHTHMKDHRRVHTGERPHQCSHCGRCFVQRSNLMKHLRSHAGEKPFRCQLCPLAFTRKMTLDAHMRAHKGLASARQRHGLGAGVKERLLHQCSLCKYTTVYHSHMKDHQRAHAGEQPHQCNLCGKGFVQRSNLVKHLRTHVGNKPLYCHVCSMEFTNKGWLTRHIRAHDKK